MISLSNLAIRVTVADPALQFYMQQYPFLTGPRKGMNARGLLT